jgi:REP element-mobilizing transposase RayT
MERKKPRLPEYDYASVGMYFVTICTKDKVHMLSSVVGRDDPGAPPRIMLSPAGKIADKYIRSIPKAYKNVIVEKYVIMPNHIHILLSITEGDGAPGSSRPTVSGIIGAFKRFTNKDIGRKIFQSSYHDHIIRDDNDYLQHWQYIDENPAKWADDEYYLITKENK